ncbi:hypothetical protein CK222_26830 [Mesorhizobium sp. WSM3866]|nr:hypothetical protein CK222_26830 [Mesorhizobium sp. WSM3866]
MSVGQRPVIVLRGLEMFWVILGFLAVASIGIVLMAGLSEVGDEPGAHRFGKLPSEDERQR